MQQDYLLLDQIHWFFLIATAAVVLGVVIEVAVEIIEHAWKIHLPKYVGLSGGSLVALGLIFEFYFDFSGSELQTKIRAAHDSIEESLLKSADKSKLDTLAHEEKLKKAEVLIQSLRHQTAEEYKRSQQLKVDNSKLKLSIAKSSQQIVTTRLRIENAEAKARTYMLELSKAKVLISKNERETSVAHLKIAEMNAATERLKADDVILQAVMSSRSVGSLGFDERPRAETYFAGISSFAGTPITIQAAPDAEAENLAQEIGLVLSLYGWKPMFVTEKISHLQLRSNSEGVMVMYPIDTNAPSEDVNKWSQAGNALAIALTKANLGILDTPVGCGGFFSKRKDFFSSPHFDNPFSGVFLKVGVRPVSLTMSMLKQRRSKQ